MLPGLTIPIAPAARRPPPPPQLPRLWVAARPVARANGPPTFPARDSATIIVRGCCSSMSTLALVSVTLLSTLAMPASISSGASFVAKLLV